MKNLFSGAPFTDDGTEQFETLLESLSGRFRLERIASHGQPTPAGEWYDQPAAEWVAVLRGEAELMWEDGTTVTLRPGDHLTIPPHRRHRVERASGDCLWLALHYSEG